MGENSVKPTKHVHQISEGCRLVVSVVVHDKSAGKDLRIGYHIGSPVERVTAVVNSAAALGNFVDGAEKLPFACAHLRAGGGAAGWSVEKKADNQAVALSDEESTELVKP